MLYVIAEHRVRISFLDDYQDAKMLSSFVSFQTDDDGSAVLLDITVDDSLRPVKKEERYLIRDVDTGNGMTKVFRVEKEVDGQISADEIVKPTASAISAYRSYTSGGAADDTAPEKADFSRILEGITREDGFSKEENLVDSDGLPVSHKTKHVMNALFGPSKASPILRVRLDDDDDDN